MKKCIDCPLRVDCLAIDPSPGDRCELTESLAFMFVEVFFSGSTQNLVDPGIYDAEQIERHKIVMEKYEQLIKGLDLYEVLSKYLTLKLEGEI